MSLIDHLDWIIDELSERPNTLYIEKDYFDEVTCVSLEDAINMKQSLEGVRGMNHENKEAEKAFRNAGVKMSEAIEVAKKGVGNKMNQLDKAKRHKEITEELNNIYVAKNHDYGDSFGETFKKLGIISAVTRITDKVNRLQSLSTKPQEEQKVKDESIKDSFYDLANYAIMSIIELEREVE